MRRLLFIKFLILLFIFSCKKDRTIENDETLNNGIMVSSEIMQLGNFFGDVFSDVVLVNTQGGPVRELVTSEFRALLELTDRDEDFFIFNVHQAQTLAPSLFVEEISFEAAKMADQESVDILAKVVRYFKEQDKKVYVLGISFGAFMAQELIRREGPEVVDKYLIMAGRLDMDELIWKSFSEGNSGGFENGVQPFTEKETDAIQRNMNKLAAGLGYRRYTTELAQYHDLSGVTYAYGTLDEAVGRLTENEKALLITRKAKILEMETDHSGVIEGLFDEGFKVAFEEE